MAASSETVQLNCPACGGRVTARWEQVGDTVECPLCHKAFEVSVPPPPPPVKEPESGGRIFHFQCMRCASVLEARSGQAGRSGKCPTCAAVFTVPLMDPRTGLAKSNADAGQDGENPTPVHAYAAAGTMAPQLIRLPDDTLIIECSRCKHHSPVTANNCPECGLPFTMEGVSSRATTSTTDRAMTACLLALFGVPLSFCGGVGSVMGVAAIVLSIQAIMSAKQSRQFAAIAGLLLGLLDCIISIAVWSRL